MINSNAPYSGLANIMNMRDRNPNTQLAYVPNGYLNSVPTAPNPYTGIPQVNSPIAMNEGGMPSMQYPMQEEAGQLADRGRYGDTTLVHMTPGEVQGLASLGQLTINPDTGLPEAFNMKALIPMIAAIGGSILMPYMAPVFASSMPLLAGAAGTALGSTVGNLAIGNSFGDSVKSGVLSGVTSFGVGAIMGGAGEGVAGGLTETPGELAYGTAAQSQAGLDAASFDWATSSGAPTVGQTITPDVIAPVTYSAEGVPTLASNGVDFSSVAGQDLFNAPPSSFFTEKAVKPGWVGRNVFGKETIPAGELTRPQYIEAGGIPSDITLTESARQQLTDPMTYGEIASGALSNAFADPYEYEEPPPRPPVDDGFGDYTLRGGTPRKSKTQEELLAIALGGGRENMFEKSYYTRNAAEGGIVGLQQGGMATPQAPSAMSAMLAPPMQQQQPMPMQQQPMQQQPMPMQGMPMQGMGQPQLQGMQPLPDQSIEFKKSMDMEGQLQQQKSASAFQGQAALLGLIGGAGNYLQSQGMNYPTTTPSGTRPQAPAMNQGTQVNMGASGGFAQGGLLGYNEGGMPLQEQGYFEGQVVGNGDGQSDEVPFKVDGGEVDMAMLSPDEYVLAADVVSYIGDGSSNAGAAKLDQFMVDVRKQAHGSGKQIEGFQERGLANLVE